MTFLAVDLVDEAQQVSWIDNEAKFFVYLAGGCVGYRLERIDLTAWQSPAPCLWITPSPHQQEQVVLHDRCTTPDARPHGISAHGERAT